MKSIVCKLLNSSTYYNKKVMTTCDFYSMKVANFSSQSIFNRIYPQISSIKKSNISPTLNSKTLVKTGVIPNYRPKSVKVKKEKKAEEKSVESKENKPDRKESKKFKETNENKSDKSKKKTKTLEKKESIKNDEKTNLDNKSKDKGHKLNKTNDKKVKDNNLKESKQNYKKQSKKKQNKDEVLKETKIENSAGLESKKIVNKDVNSAKLSDSNDANSKESGKKKRYISKRAYLRRMEFRKKYLNAKLRRYFKVKTNVVEEPDEETKKRIKKQNAKKLAKQLKKPEVEVKEEKSTLSKLKDNITSFLGINSDSKDANDSKEIDSLISKQKDKVKPVKIIRDLNTRIMNAKQSALQKYDKIIDDSRSKVNNTKVTRYKRMLLKVINERKSKKPLSKQEIIKKNIEASKIKSKSFKIYLNHNMSVEKMNRLEYLKHEKKNVDQHEELCKLRDTPQNKLKLQEISFKFDKLKKITSCLERNEYDQLLLNNNQLEEISKATGFSKSYIIKYDDDYFNTYFQWKKIKNLCLKGPEYIPVNHKILSKHIEKLSLNDEFYNYRDKRSLRKQEMQRDSPRHEYLRECYHDYYMYTRKRVFKTNSSYLLH